MNDHRKRLAIITPGYYEQVVGGTEYQCYLLAEAAKGIGMDVHYVYVRVDSVMSVPNKLGISLHPVRSPGYRRYVRGIGHTAVFCIPQTWNIVASIQPDCVYCRSGVVQAGLGAYYAKRRGCKSIWHVASSIDVTPPPFLSLLRRPLNLLEWRSIEYAIRNSTHVVAHARFQAELLQRHFGREATVILKEQPEPAEAIEKSGLCKVVWVANIKPLKQPEAFIRLAGEFAEDKDVQFTMIGRPSRGRYQEQLDAQIQALPNLTYMREQPIEEVNRVLAQSHIFVNTSTYEGLPNTFVQAWMREVPVISMLLDPDGIVATHGIGCCSGSFEQMVFDVRSLVADPALRNEMGKRARQYAIANHSLKKNMGQLLDLIMS